MIHNQPCFFLCSISIKTSGKQKRKGNFFLCPESVSASLLGKYTYRVTSVTSSEGMQKKEAPCRGTVPISVIFAPGRSSPSPKEFKTKIYKQYWEETGENGNLPAPKNPVMMGLVSSWNETCSGMYQAVPVSSSLLSLSSLRLCISHSQNSE